MTLFLYFIRHKLTIACQNSNQRKNVYSTRDEENLFRHTLKTHQANETNDLALELFTSNKESYESWLGQHQCKQLYKI